MKGLVIRYFMGGYYLCDGKPPKGRENDGELYIGNAVKWFETYSVNIGIIIFGIIMTVLVVVRITNMFLR